MLHDIVYILYGLRLNICEWMCVVEQGKVYAVTLYTELNIIGSTCLST
jgi:hypothetical protein